jgi:hypothetical protein
MKRMVIVVSLFVMLFVAVSPCFAGGPHGGGHQGGGFVRKAGRAVGNYAQQSAQGWNYAVQSSGQVAQAVGQQVASDAKAVGQAVQKANQATANYGDSLRIGQAIDKTTRRAQGK